VSHLGRRVRDLEGGSAKPGRCSECGLAPNPEQNQIEYAVEWEDPLDDAAIAELTAWYERGCPPAEMPAAYREPEAEKPCPACGRAREVIIDWDDSPTSLEQAKMDAKFFAERPWEKEEEAGGEERFWTGDRDRVPDYPPSEDGWEGGGVDR